MNGPDLISALQRLGHPRILVLGDLILDRYTWGNAERVSQEAPVILMRADQREARLGGAANVCHMLRGLEAEVTVAAAIGQDDEGRTLRTLLNEAGVCDACLLADPARPTTVKERFIGRAANRHPHQILRVDSESREPLAAPLEHELARRIRQQIDQFDVLLISDYDKGVCTPGLLADVICAAREAHLSVLVDPIRSADYSRYRGATTMTPNRLEAGLATGIAVRSIDSAFAAGRKLCDSLGLEYAIVTLDRDGMALVHRDGSTEHFPTRPREVYDITGAGDMVLATIGLCLASGLSAEEALRLANIAGGLEVEKVGVAPITREEMRIDLLHGSRHGSLKLLSLEQAARLAEVHRARGQRIAFTDGCFDLLHMGHIAHLSEAAAQGEILFVGLESDALARLLKGPGRPVIKQQDRGFMLTALACVDYVTTFGDRSPIELIRRIRPDVLVKGADCPRRLDQIAGADFVHACGGRVHFTRQVDGVSTTRLVQLLAA
jgi:D-beta-D-heptose 7-phosphate kinase/D-beta-D-heptose 1-phosphate adenosyltransferase